MNYFKECCSIKPESIGSSEKYISSDIRKIVDSSDRILYWNMGSNAYIKEKIQIIDNLLSKSKLKVKGKGNQLYSSLSRHTGLYITLFYYQDQHTVFQNLIGILIYTITFGRIDINLEDSRLYTYLMGPRIGHLNQTFHILYYLKRHQSLWLPMDPMKIEIEYKSQEDHSLKVRRKVMKVIHRVTIDKVNNNILVVRKKKNKYLYGC